MRKRTKPTIPNVAADLASRDAFRMLPGRIMGGKMFVLVKGTWFPEREVRAAMKPSARFDFFTRQTLDGRVNWLL